MSTQFADLDAVFSPGIRFSIAGRPYTILPPSAEVGLWCQRLAQAAGVLRAAETDAELAAAMEQIGEVPDLPGDLTMPQRVLGPLWQQLADDGVDHARIRFVALTAFAWVIGDEDAARRYWDSGGRPEAVAPNRATRRAAATAATGAASMTPSRGSGSGTRSRPSRRRRGGGGRSAGRTS